MKKIAVFASGRGSNFQAIFAQIKSGNINAEVVCLISNNPKAHALEYARKKHIPVFSIDVNTPASTEQLLTILENYSAELIVLAGYMKLIPTEVVERYSNKIINIHPALLPAFGGKGCYGMNVHKKVLKSGVKFTGVTIHFVNNNYDDGQIIAQEIVPVLQNDSPEDVAKRVLKTEHKLYPEILKQICNDQLNWINNKPWITEFKGVRFD